VNMSSWIESVVMLVAPWRSGPSLVRRRLLRRSTAEPVTLHV
jgi:hypothetical protein